MAFSELFNRPHENHTFSGDKTSTVFIGLTDSKKTFFESEKLPPNSVVSSTNEIQASVCQGIEGCSASLPSGEIPNTPSDSTTTKSRSEHPVWEESTRILPATMGQERKKTGRALHKSVESLGTKEYKQFRARELGLPEDVTWGEIFAFLDKQERIAVAKVLGWKEDRKLTSEARRLDMDESPSWRNILVMLLDLDQLIIPPSAEQLIARIREMKETIRTQSR